MNKHCIKGGSSMYITINILITVVTAMLIFRLIIHTGIKVLQIIYGEPQQPIEQSKKTKQDLPHSANDTVYPSRRNAGTSKYVYAPVTAYYSPMSVRTARIIEKRNNKTETATTAMQIYKDKGML